jgi:hypothetical protein
MQWAIFVFVQLGMKPDGWIAVVLSFRDLIHGQEALFTTTLSISDVCPPTSSGLFSISFRLA